MEMDENIELQDYGNVIEGALCSYDVEKDMVLRDSDIIKIVELLIDKYHFGDQQIDTNNLIILGGVYHVKDAIRKDMPDIDKTTLVKILGVIRFVAKRRTKAGREYINIIHQYVGQRIDTGI